MVKIKVKDTITIKQEHALKEIIGYIETFGYPPTMKELGYKLGLSETGIRAHVSALVKKGYLKKRHYTARGIEPIKGIEGIIKRIRPKKIKQVKRNDKKEGLVDE